MSSAELQELEQQLEQVSRLLLESEGNNAELQVIYDELTEVGLCAQ
jgi:hypothetical protein